MTVHRIETETALPDPSKVKPGDTIQFEGGVHTGCRDLRYVGTPEAPILVTNAPGEIVSFQQPAVAQGVSTPHSLWLGGAYTIVEENPAGGELRIDHNVGVGEGNGFTIAADHVVVRNIRCRGVFNNNRNRCLGGRVSGLVSSRSGFDPPGSNRGSGYVLYAQNDGRSRLVITDLLCGLSYTHMIHIYGGDHAARDITLQRSSLLAANSLSSLNQRAEVVVNEENRVDPQGNPAWFDNIEIDDCVIGSPNRYPEGGGWGQVPIALGGDAHSATTVNGRVKITNCDFIGRPGAAERIAWGITEGNRIFVRGGSSTDAQGWEGKSFSNLLNGPRGLAQVFFIVGLPDQIPNLDPQIRVWKNPTEPGRAHVSVLSMKNERSVSVDLSGVIERGQKFSAFEIMRETKQESTGSASGTVPIELPDIVPAGVKPERNPHPVAFQFLIRKA